MEALTLMRNGGAKLLLDFDNKILGEYERVLLPGSLGRRAYSRWLGWGLVEYRSGLPTQTCRERLKRDGFDEDDIAYVGVAQRAPNGVYVTHEGKHLRAARVELIRESCNVRLCDTGGLLDLLGSE